MTALADIATPALLLDLDAAERNIRRMADHASRHGIRLRPHTKTHKSIEIARRQIAAGAVGVCCATLGEAEVMVDGGIADVLITSPVIGTAKVRRLAALAARAERLAISLDDPAQVEAISAALPEGTVLDVLVDVDVGNRRTGVPAAQAAVALARLMDAKLNLRFAGLQGYAGHLQHIANRNERLAASEAVAAQLAQARDALTQAGLMPAIITGGGTGTHDLDHRTGVFGELQAGSYVVMDVDYNRIQLREEDAHPFETALFVRTTVISAAQDGFAIADGGLKAFATDGPAPEITSGAPPGATYVFAGDEHGRIVYGKNTERLKPGDAVTCRVPHCDPTINLYDSYHVIRGKEVIDIWPVDARGRH